MLITHDMGVVSELADDVAVMYMGSIVERGSVREVLKYPAHPYTAALLYDGQVASLMRYMSGGPVVDQPDIGTDSDTKTESDPTLPTNPDAPQQPDATVPDSKNNASLTIPNNRIPASPKTGDSFPVAALAALGMASVLGLLTVRRHSKKK